MDFGKILDKWEKQNKNSSYPDKDTSLQNKPERLITKKDLKKIKPQAEIDLHGCTAPEAKDQLLDFLKESKNRGFTKVKVIHGKGLHSQGESVLCKVVDDVIYSSKLVRKSGYFESREGGHGSRWIILK